MITTGVDSKKWRKVYAESFTKSAATGRVGAVYGPAMNGYVGYKDTSHNGTYAPDKVLQVAGGHLKANLHSEVILDAKGNPVKDEQGHDEFMTYVASVWPAVTFTGSKMNGKRFRKIRFRMRATGSSHFKVVGEGWTADDSWRGEICFPEGAVGQQAYLNVHSITPPHERNVVSEPIPGVSLAEWHTYDIEVGPGYQRYRVLDTGYDRWVLNPDAQFPVDWRFGLQDETSTEDGVKPALGDKALVEVDNWQEWDYIG